MAAVLCIGGAILDRKVRLLGEPVPGTSNPVSVSWSPGGVARNVAEHLWRLGVGVELLSRVGDDDAGRRLLASVPGVSAVEVVPGASTSTYDAVLAPDGSLVIGLVEGSLLEGMDGAWIGARAALVGSAPWVVIDGNLPADGVTAVLEASLAAGCRVGVVPVSVPKAARLGRLRGTALLVCNREEAAALVEVADPAGPAGTAPIDPAGPAGPAEALRALGVSVAVVTDGGRPTAVAWEGGIRHVTPPPVAVVDVTGAGDAMFAGVLAALVGGADPVSAVAAGHERAARTLATARTVPDA